MSIDQVEPAKPQAGRVVGFSEGLIRIRDEAAFGASQGDLCTRFLGRVFALGEVRSVTIDRGVGVALVRHAAGPDSLPDFLARMADSIRGRADYPASGFLPPFLGGAERLTVRRHGAILTTCEVILDSPGRLQLGHESLRGNRGLAGRVVASLRAVPGVLGARAEVGPGRLVIRYVPSAIPARRLIRLAEASLNQGGSRPAVPAPSMPTRLGVTNVSLGVAAVGEFLVPALLPVSAVLLVGTNIRVFKVAWLQVRSRKLGLAVLYMAIVATTLATGQFLASALMTWSFRYWHRRFRSELASERGRLLGRVGEESPMARMATAGGPDILVAFDRLNLGDRVTVTGGETVPADGRVIGGEGVVDERSVRGPEGISRKWPGDFVMADARVLAGSLAIEVTGVGDRTRAASIRRALVASTDPAPGPLAPTIRSEAFASRAVGPTLATAGVGLLAGDLLTVGAILRPDYATGPGLAVPLETLRLVTLLARRGIVVRDPAALERLAEVDLMVLDDHPALARIELEVTRVETRLPEPIVLRYAASAFRHLVDDRAMALATACRRRAVHLLDLEPVDLSRGVAITHGAYQVRVFDPNPAAPADSFGPLLVEIDGTIVGLIEFGRSSRLEAASTLARVRRGSPNPIAFALVSSRGEAETSTTARSLGVDLYRGDFSAEETAAFLRGCREKGIRTAFVGDCRERPGAARESHVALSFVGEADLESDPAGLLLQQARTRSLADLWEFSRAHAGRVRQAENFILVPNLLCVAGAFLFGFTGMTAVMLSNLGTLGLYRRASDSLRELDAPGPRRAGSRHRAG